MEIHEIIALCLFAFCVGLLVGWLLARKWKREAAYLRKQLDETERLVDGLAWLSHPAEPPLPSPEGPEEDQPPSRSEFEDTQNLGVTPPVDSASMEKRRVRVTRILGKSDGIQRREAFEGVEEALPGVGKRYCVSTNHETVIRTSTVVQVSSAYFMTRNSVYQIEVLTTSP